MLFVMNEIEKRRLDLLVRTKKIYNEKYAPPAIHPRYQSAFRFLYGTETEEKRWGVESFLVRFLIALLILHEIFVFGPRVLFALGFLFFQKKK